MTAGTKDGDRRDTPARPRSPLAGRTADREVAKGTSSPQRRRLASVVLVLLGIVVASGVQRAAYLRRDTLARWSQLLGAQAVLTESAVESWLAERVADGRLTAQSTTSFEALFRTDRDESTAPHLAGSTDRLGGLLSAVQSSRAYTGVWALAPTGRIVAASALAGELADDERAAATDAVRFSRPGVVGVQRQPNGTLRLTFVSPIMVTDSGRTGPARSIGAIVLRVDPAATLFHLVGRDPVRTRTGESGLVARDRNTLVVLSALEVPRAGAFTVRIPWGAAPLPGRLAAAGVETTGVARDLRGKSVVFATRHIPHTGWGLVYRVDESEALAGYRRELLGEILLALAVLGVMSLATVALNRQARIARLRASADSSERLAGILDAAMEAIVTIDEHQRITLFNAAAEQLTGWSAAEAIGQPLGRLMPEPYRDRHDQGFMTFAESGEAAARVGRSGRYRILRADGESVPVEASISRLGTGSQTLYTIVALDISERQRAGEALRRSEASFRSFVEHAPYGIYRSTPEGRFIAANQALADLLGYASADELQSIDLGRDVYVDAALRERLRRELWRENRFDLHNVEWKRKDGSVVRVRISGRHVRNADGKIEYLEAFVEDVTRLRDAELLLRRSERLAAVGQLVSGVAHELNNPLSAILHFAEDLLEDSRSASDVEALTIVRDRALRARTIVRDLLTFARKDLDERKRVDVAAMLERLVVVLRRDVEQLGARLHLIVKAAPCPVLADVAGLEQVVTNLVLNAAQATGAGGEVTIRLRQVDQRYEFIVEDDGPGIAPDVLPRLFEPFFTTKPTGQGTGLGLSVSVGIVQRNGGTIIGGNRNGSEKGARFVVSLPYAGSDTEGVAAATHAAGERFVDASDSVASDGAVLGTPPSGAVAHQVENRCVLIVDDEPAIRTALRRFFERRGWQVDDAEDGSVGLDMLLASGATRPAYTAALCDLRMPGVSGIELHDRLAAERPDLLRRVIFSTGDTASPDAAAFVERTHCPIIEKPFQFAQLVRLIEETCSQRIDGIR